MLRFGLNILSRYERSLSHETASLVLSMRQATNEHSFPRARPSSLLYSASRTGRRPDLTSEDVILEKVSAGDDGKVKVCGVDEAATSVVAIVAYSSVRVAKQAKDALDATQPPWLSPRVSSLSLCRSD